MVTRRTFLSGAAVSSAILGAPAARAVSRAEASPVPGRAIIDRSLPGGEAFAQGAREHGAAVEWFSGDVSLLWLTKLTPMLRARAEPIAGLTHAGALFCLERWAWDLGMRVVMRVDHVPTAGGGWRHEDGARLPAAAAAHLQAAGPDFARQAAAVAFAGSSLWGDCTHAAAARGGDGQPDPIVSWVIAPAPARA